MFPIFLQIVKIAALIQGRTPVVFQIVMPEVVHYIKIFLLYFLYPGQLVVVIIGPLLPWTRVLHF